MGRVSGWTGDFLTQDFLLDMDLDFGINLSHALLQPEGDPQTSQSNLTAQVEAPASPPGLLMEQLSGQIWKSLRSHVKSQTHPPSLGRLGWPSSFHLGNLSPSLGV